MNRLVLILNALILVVTFVVALSSQSSQLDILGSTANAAATPYARGPADVGAAFACLRLLQSLDQFSPRDKIDAFTPEQVRALLNAAGHYAWLAGDFGREVRTANGDGAKPRAAVEEFGRASRAAVQQMLEREFRDPEFVGRVTAAILGGAR
jgi:hypothetical protein